MTTDIQTKKQKEIVPTFENTPAEMIKDAVMKGADLEKLHSLMDLQMKWEANEAKKAYNLSMAEVHAKIPAIIKTKRNNQTSSMYADLGEIIKAVQPIYSAEGFSVSFGESETSKPDHIRILIYVTHKFGHQETFYYDMPLDGKGIKGNVNMTAIHAKASSISYGRRYLTCMVFNIPTEDDDGNMAGSPIEYIIEYIDEKQLSTILDHIDNKNVDKTKFKKWLGIDEIEKMPKKYYNKAIKALEAKQ